MVRFSIIIPARVETEYLRETLTHLDQQTLKSFEVLLITDQISVTANPAQKRNLGAQKARGEFLAFLDDDSYPDKDWLKNALKLFTPNITAVCGPCLTPPEDNLCQQASGLVWGSLLGSGGAGVYRNSIQKPRFVDDYPSVNLIVRKKDFWAVNGFDTHHWPGEDTILCLNLTKRHHQILYHPSIVVYHHRRQVLTPHLQQITRYALHRGYFARVFPQTSLRLGYLLPSFLVSYFLLLPFLIYRISCIVYPLLLYFFLLFVTFISFLRYHCLKLSLLAAITIPITHIYYGILFIVGFFKKKLVFQPHQTNPQGYVGG
jgi:glycosyltransferase involved in cell wall biosynthesis